MVNGYSVGKRESHINPTVLVQLLIFVCGVQCFIVTAFLAFLKFYHLIETESGQVKEKVKLTHAIWLNVNFL